MFIAPIGSFSPIQNYIAVEIHSLKDRKSVRSQKVRKLQDAVIAVH